MAWMGMMVRAEPAPVGEPLQGVADAGAVDAACTDAADGCSDVQHGERLGDRVQHPGDGDQHAADQHHDLRPEAVDDPAFDRHQPGFHDDEDGERDLDRRAAPMEFRVDRPDEQRPPVLQVGDHHHADDADEKLQPTSGRLASGGCGGSWRHSTFPPDCRSYLELV